MTEEAALEKVYKRRLKEMDDAAVYAISFIREFLPRAVEAAEALGQKDLDETDRAVTVKQFRGAVRKIEAAAERLEGARVESGR